MEENYAELRTSATRLTGTKVKCLAGRARPSYTTRTPMILTGIGATPIEKFTDLYNTAAEKLEKILVHTRNCDTTPVEGNASLGVLLAKPSGKKGMAGQRLIHVC